MSIKNSPQGNLYLSESTTPAEAIAQHPARAEISPTLPLQANQADSEGLTDRKDRAREITVTFTAQEHEKLNRLINALREHQILTAHALTASNIARLALLRLTKLTPEQIGKELRDPTCPPA